MKTMNRLLMLFTLCLPGAAAAENLAQALSLQVPDSRANVIHLAVAAMECATRNGQTFPERLAVIDYSLPSTEKRLWVFDLKQRSLLFQELVAHGRNSGMNYANQFSNTNGSYQSSLGLFRTLNTYHGKHGYSLRMEGVEEGVNDNAFERAIVIHGADYVNPGLIAKQGRIGRSLGCPAVSKSVARPLIDHLKDGQFVFAYYPDPQWLTSSAFLSCGSAQGPLASALADTTVTARSIE